MTAATAEKSPVRDLGRAAWRLLLAAGLLYGVGTTAYLIARLAVGERWSAVAWANNFVPWWALGGLVAAIVAAVGRRWRLAALHVPILLAFALLYGDLLLPPGSVAQAGDGVTIKVATYNILSHFSDPDQVVAVIRDMDADVVGFEEVGPEHADRIQAELGEDYPYQVWYPQMPVHGVGLISRYPILEEAPFSALPDSMRHLRAVIDTPGGPVTVFVAHPRPPHGLLPTGYDDSLRDAELADLRVRVRTESGPVLMLCDCNMSDQSDAYQATARILHDSFRESGWGLDFSYPNRLRDLAPGLRIVRIDYVWHSDHFTALEARTWTSGGSSDHRPVVARLSLKATAS
ncbi:MAG TPA: endonuclease/exonuclease/phosphatase family protein [Aggregatilinea sp.]|uniref:endonuclease/exonuclease/phosphatase family protein n=1 Tax=Aggregatilinea sp. TaxID=2806333 RepID=UPI002C4FF2C8|nr:endonuclease/exonuclease/phosphatase family protein [Aggregatilinea sp.]HML24477.1 endonuclease/exonuclease/phosphatase family protein [Aggregatilinea sp.]